MDGARVISPLEVPPERLGISPKLGGELAFWRTLHDAFYHLWLASGEYESWAKAQLSNITSPVNTVGLGLCIQLNATRPCYYWWFVDTSEDFEPLPTATRAYVSKTSRPAS
jgi:hypothetical protein